MEDGWDLPTFPLPPDLCRCEHMAPCSSCYHASHQHGQGPSNDEPKAILSSLIACTRHFATAVPQITFAWPNRFTPQMKNSDLLQVHPLHSIYMVISLALPQELWNQSMSSVFRATELLPRMAVHLCCVLSDLGVSDKPRTPTMMRQL